MECCCWFSWSKRKEVRNFPLLYTFIFIVQDLSTIPYRNQSTCYCIYSIIIIIARQNGNGIIIRCWLCNCCGNIAWHINCNCITAWRSSLCVMNLWSSERTDKGIHYIFIHHSACHHDPNCNRYKSMKICLDHIKNSITVFQTSSFAEASVYHLNCNTFQIHYSPFRSDLVT